MKAVIVEDEKRNSTQLRALIAKNCPQVDVIGEGADADSGRNLIHSLQPDLVFLDIQLPGKSGFDMLAEIGNCSFQVIFVSGYDHYGIQAIKFSALDYLLKPVKPKELVEAVRKAQAGNSRKSTDEKISILLSHLEDGDTKEKRIALPLIGETRFVSIADIMHLESRNSYTKFFMRENEMLLSSRGLFSYEVQLQSYGFTRCHQSHLVNRRYIRSLVTKDGVFEFILTDGTRIPVSRLKLLQIRSELGL